MRLFSIIAIFIGLNFTAVNAQDHFCEDHLFAYASPNEMVQDSTDQDTIEQNSNTPTEENVEIERLFIQEEWTIGPNPTYGTVNIYGDLNNIKTIEVYSITGELLEFHDEYSYRTSIDLSPYQNGIYLIRILSQYNDLKTYKVIKR